MERKYVLRTPARLKTYRVDYDRELNDEQREVVLAGGGPILVIAGAGSGKTRTLVYRVRHPVRKNRLHPWLHGAQGTFRRAGPTGRVHPS